MRLSEERSREWGKQSVYASKREMVSHLWILPIYWHHLSQGLMTADDHVIVPRDPSHLVKNGPDLLRPTPLGSEAKAQGMTLDVPDTGNASEY